MKLEYLNLTVMCFIDTSFAAHHIHMAMPRHYSLDVLFILFYILLSSRLTDRQPTQDERNHLAELWTRLIDLTSIYFHRRAWIL